jgi:hypothetical protein
MALDRRSCFMLVVGVLLRCGGGSMVEICSAVDVRRTGDGAVMMRSGEEDMRWP